MSGFRGVGPKDQPRDASSGPPKGAHFTAWKRPGTIVENLCAGFALDLGEAGVVPRPLKAAPRSMKAAGTFLTSRLSHADGPTSPTRSPGAFCRRSARPPARFLAPARGHSSSAFRPRHREPDPG